MTSSSRAQEILAVSEARALFSPSGLVDFDSYRAEQTKWLRGIVQEESFRNSRYRIVLVHMPPSPHGQAYGVTQVRELWSATLNRAHILQEGGDFGILRV